MAALREEAFHARPGLTSGLLGRLGALASSIRRPTAHHDAPGRRDNRGSDERASRPSPEQEIAAIRRSLESANEELRRQNSAVRESRARMIQADEAAKRAIAEELHGTVQTRLYVLWVKLSMLRDRFNRESLPGATELDKLAAEVDNIREENIRKLSHRLHPAVVRLGAISALRSLRDFFESYVPIDLQIEPEASELEPAGVARLPEHIRLGMYRIAELALGNVVKHARATRCTIRWSYSPDKRTFVLAITDNGVGLAPDARVPSGIGLVTMNDYADALNGTLTVTSYPAKGTRVEVSIPFVAELGRPEESQGLGTLVNLHYSSPE